MPPRSVPGRAPATGRTLRRRPTPFLFLALVAVLPLGGCASASGVGTGAPAPAGDEALEALSERIRLPAAEVMSPDVRLVTYGRVAGDRRGTVHRDTLRGPEAVSDWLVRQHAHERPEVEFYLRPGQTLLCADHVVQTGSYELKSGNNFVPVVKQPFTARWVRTAGDSLLLDGLWLDPDGAGTPGKIASGCVSWARLEGESSRFAVGLSILASRGPADGVVRDEVPYREMDEYLAVLPPIGWLASVDYRFAPRMWVGAVYIRPATTSFEGVRATNRLAVMEATNNVLGLLGRVRIGPFLLGAGPAVNLARVEWSEEFVEQCAYLCTPDRLAASEESSEVALGVMGEAALELWLMRGLTGRLAVRQSAFQSVQTPQFMEAEPFEIPLGRTSLSLGVAWRFR